MRSGRRVSPENQGGGKLDNHTIIPKKTDETKVSPGEL